MKKLLSLTLISSTLLFSGSLSSTEITNMISKIKEERVGITLSELDDTPSPFIVKVKEAVEEIVEVNITKPLETVYTLKAILNHAAFINKKWYRTGDTIGNYKVGYVSSNTVILKSSSGNRKLSLEKKKKKFIKLNQGNR